jgi:hypothetical protein
MNVEAEKKATKSPSSEKTVRKPKGPHALRGGTSEANRLAIAILEVLAGVRTPAEAAANVNLSLVRYFQLETRALQGMVKALEPLPKGKQSSLDVRLRQLEKQLQQSRRECTRQQALVRVAQRTVGFPLTTSPNTQGNGSGRKGAKTGDGVKQKKKRRPMVRALKAVQALRSRSASAPSADPAAVPDPNESAAALAAKNDRRESTLAVQLSSRVGSQEDRTPEVPGVSY